MEVDAQHCWAGQPFQSSDELKQIPGGGKLGAITRLTESRRRQAQTAKLKAATGPRQDKHQAFEARIYEMAASAYTEQ